MKSVPIYPNSQTNNACLQSCVKGVLDYFGLSDQIMNVDNKTGYHNDAFSWIPQTVIWLSSLGLDVCLYTPGDYEIISKGDKECTEYLRNIKGDLYNLENSRGDYKYIEEIREASKIMIKNNLWRKESLDDIKLSQILNDDNSLAIGKTVHQWLGGNFERLNPTTHWITIIKEFSSEIWRINDPGLPPIENRTIQKQIQGNRILGEILLIKSKGH